LHLILSPCRASDKEQIKSLAEHPINVHENTVKTHEFSGVYFHLKGSPRQGPTKLTQALSAEGSHRGSLPGTQMGQEKEIFGAEGCEGGLERASFQQQVHQIQSSGSNLRDDQSSTSN